MKKMHLAVPALAAMVGMVMMAQAGPTSQRGDSYIIDTAPTPYSMDHAVAQIRGQDDIGAPSF